MSFDLINDAPRRTVDYPFADAVGVLEDSSVQVNILEYHSDAEDTLTGSSLSILRYPAHGSVSNLKNGSVVYAPKAHYFGDDTISFNVCDPQGTCARGSVVFAVSHINDLPVSENITDVTAEDTKIEIDLSKHINDVYNENAGLLNGLCVTEQPNHGRLTWKDNVSLPLVCADVLSSITPANTSDAKRFGAPSAHAGIIVYTPYVNSNDFTAGGADTFGYRVCDAGKLCSVPSQVTVSVTAVNDAPVSTHTSHRVSLQEDGFGHLNLTGTITDVEDTNEKIGRAHV